MGCKRKGEGEREEEGKPGHWPRLLSEGGEGIGEEEKGGEMCT